MSIIKDKYILGQSETTSITTNGQEATANLKLSLNTKILMMKVEL